MEVYLSNFAETFLMLQSTIEDNKSSTMITSIQKSINVKKYFEKITRVSDKNCKIPMD